MTVAPPPAVVWDVTYACPLRCTHCYSEAGRRPSRRLGRDDLLRVTDALISMQPGAIVFAGGEPLLVPEIYEAADRIAAAGVRADVYTGGWTVAPDVVDPLLDAFWKVTVSVDGATAAVHDAIRGRAGSFDRAMAALAYLDEAIGRRRGAGHETPTLGIDFVVMRSNFAQVGDFCAQVASRFANLDFVFFGPVLPIGLASRADFAGRELLTEEQLDRLRSEEFALELQARAPETVQVVASDNGMFQMHPDRLAAGEIPAMQVEPDGRVRAMPIYEGTVGSLLEEDAMVLWERAVQRWSDPWVSELLRSSSSMDAWAEATRRIDHRFGSDDDRVRIARRPAYVAHAT
jgi:MoaA/NifB/PqqE/SkfB family radical SAM enzyme